MGVPCCHVVYLEYAQAAGDLCRVCRHHMYQDSSLVKRHWNRWIYFSLWIARAVIIWCPRRAAVGLFQLVSILFSNAVSTRQTYLPHAFNIRLQYFEA